MDPTTILKTSSPRKHTNISQQTGTPISLTKAELFSTKQSTSSDGRARSVANYSDYKIDPTSTRAHSVSAVNEIKVPRSDEYAENSEWKSIIQCHGGHRAVGHAATTTSVSISSQSSSGVCSPRASPTAQSLPLVSTKKADNDLKATRKNYRGRSRSELEFKGGEVDDYGSHGTEPEQREQTTNVSIGAAESESHTENSCDPVDDMDVNKRRDSSDPKSKSTVKPTSPLENSTLDDGT